MKVALRSLTAAVAGLAIATLAGCGGGPKQAAKAAPGTEETAYLQNIQLTPGRVEAAQNFLNHTVTSVYGAVTNNGKKTVRNLEINLTFSDIEGKPIEQKTATPVGNNDPPLKPGETRQFQLSFDQVPDMWNQAPPRMAPAKVTLDGK
ncbi:MAG TPA: FxLYD domain-containing protein [Terriglobia bacterium]|nr:FxLYD domain-containing protein [Terriglobia bacterium]